MEVVYWPGEVVDYTIYYFIHCNVCFSDKQQSTSKSWMPTSGEAGGGLGNVNWRRWGEHACTKNTMKPTIHNLPASTDSDSDDWVVMEELRPRRRQRIMQQ